MKKTPYSESVLSEEIGIKESNSFYNILKRIFDLILSVFLVALLSPFFVLISLIIFLETGNSPIFAQQRGLILEGNEFRIFKFRTLRHNKLALKEPLHIFRKEDLSGLVTFSGFVLRRTGLDELPQLLNVLKGEMSLVGPRPLSLWDLQMMKENDPALYNRRKFITSKPGITGYWQIYGNRQKGVHDLIEADEHYEKNKSFIFDLFLIAMTIPIMFFTKHSDAIIGKYNEF
ncbi:MAG: sugar transferase [Ignavibacteriaceae bacterium]|nr:sugar transferase [Ignavibacteriaceae bacterium]